MGVWHKKWNNFSFRGWDHSHGHPHTGPWCHCRGSTVPTPLLVQPPLAPPAPSTRGVKPCPFWAPWSHHTELSGGSMRDSMVVTWLEFGTCFPALVLQLWRAGSSQCAGGREGWVHLLPTLEPHQPWPPDLLCPSQLGVLCALEEQRGLRDRSSPILNGNELLELLWQVCDHVWGSRGDLGCGAAAVTPILGAGHSARLAPCMGTQSFRLPDPSGFPALLAPQSRVLPF